MDQEIFKSIIESGHKVSFRTKNILEQNYWETNISQRYVDDVTGSIKEIDLIADYIPDKGPLEIETKEGTLTFSPVLIVETKYLVKPLVLFTQKNLLDLIEDERFLYKSWINGFGDDKVSKIIDPIRSGHRFYTNSLSVLSENINNSGSKDPFFESTSQVIKTAQFKKKYNPKYNKLIMYLPVVVYKNGPILVVPSDINLDSEQEILEKTKEVKYATALVNYQEYFEREYHLLNDRNTIKGWEEKKYFVDIVHIDELPKLLNIIRRDIHWVFNSFKKAINN